NGRMLYNLCVGLDLMLDADRREFKMVLVSFCKLNDGEDVQSEVHVYTLGSDTWRKLIGVLDKCLSLVDSSWEQKSDVWVFKDYDGKMSWNKLFSMRKNMICPYSGRSVRPVRGVKNGGLVRPIQVLKNGEILLMCGLTDLVAYNTKSNQCRFLQMDDHRLDALGTYYFLAVPFVGSLISIKSIFATNCEGKCTT
ncbi:hypothetical protein IFM89_036834, partial [Coptis chinensis]